MSSNQQLIIQLYHWAFLLITDAFNHPDFKPWVFFSLPLPLPHKQLVHQCFRLLFLRAFFHLAMVWMFVSPRNVCVQILTPKGDGISRWGGFGKWLNHEGEVLSNGISDLTKETPQSFQAPSTSWGCSEKAEPWKGALTGIQPCCHRGLSPPASRTVSKGTFVVYKPPGVVFS